MQERQRMIGPQGAPHEGVGSAGRVAGLASLLKQVYILHIDHDYCIVACIVKSALGMTTGG